jgi:hypothetical protein
MLGLGDNLSELKKRIHEAQEDLAKVGLPEQPMPEVINMTNLLRANEYLTQTDQKKTELVLAYEEYTQQLEKLVTSLLSIQADLKEIVETEAAIIGKGRKKPKKTTKRRKSKKRK